MPKKKSRDNIYVLLVFAHLIGLSLLPRLVLMAFVVWLMITGDWGKLSEVILWGLIALLGLFWDDLLWPVHMSIKDKIISFANAKES